MIKFFHQLMNPHCQDCIEELQESKRCNSCETLRIENDRLRLENERLLEKLLREPEPVPEYKPEKEFQPIMPKTVPWNVRRQALEAEDRQTAKLKKKVTEELEQTLGIKEEDNAS